jgi:hypothetical protein
MRRWRHSRRIEPMTRSAKGFLPGRARCGDDLANAQVLDPGLKISAVDDIAIAEQVGEASLVGNAWTIC